MKAHRGAGGEPDPKTVDVISRFYTRVKQGVSESRHCRGEDKERAEKCTLGAAVGNCGTYQ